MVSLQEIPAVWLYRGVDLLSSPLPLPPFLLCFYLVQFGWLPPLPSPLSSAVNLNSDRWPSFITCASPSGSLWIN